MSEFIKRDRWSNELDLTELPCRHDTQSYHRHLPCPTCYPYRTLHVAVPPKLAAVSYLDESLPTSVAFEEETYESIEVSFDQGRTTRIWTLT